MAGKGQKRQCLSGSRKIPKDTRAHNHHIKHEPFCNTDPLDQTVFRVTDQNKERSIGEDHAS